MKILPIILTFAILAGCNRPQSVEEILSETDHWTYVIDGTFSDGGSVAYGFLNRNGVPLYVWVGPPPKPTEKLKIYLKRNLNDQQAVEIIPASKMEKTVLNLIKTCDLPKPIKEYKSITEKLQTILVDRSAPFFETDPQEKEVEPLLPANPLQH